MRRRREMSAAEAAVKVARIQSRAAVLQQGLNLLHNPVFCLVAGIAAAEGLHKAGLLDDRFTKMLEGGIVGMSIAAAAKEAGLVGAGLAAGGMAGGTISGMGRWQQLSMLGGLPGQMFAGISSIQ